MKIIITGGAGFIGTHVVKLFVKKYPNYSIYNLDALTYAGNLENLKDIETYPNYHFIKADITDEQHINSLFQEIQPNAVIHLAAESHVDRSIMNPNQFVITNVLGTIHLLNASRKLNDFQVFYHISTDEVYGSLGETGYFTEKTPYDPRSPYSASKASSDHFVRSYYHTYHLPIKISNCSNNYGPYQFPEKLIPLCINNILNEKPLPIYGKGENVRDWLFVEDHSRAIDLIFHKGKIGETYNIGGNSEKKNIEVVQTLCKIMNKKMNKPEGYYEKLITFVKDRAGHDLRYAIDFTKLKTELNWTPSVSFEEGIEKTIDWYLNNSDWLKSVTSGNYQKYYEEQYIKR
ncbi:MAG: dTDP-glucose 4,6-dehydratase [Bacteroidia bacterium]|nr:MAG: dTDP-glucose 4,6-dehydratase [Bacteroidia bacterium]